ncbi:MAG TPA: RHS repeat-associated core domain-containing protein [Pirellulales bacterium]|nr:RHS repeat-associated core domain-containing protein [Pirellulales bacterium]
MTAETQQGQPNGNAVATKGISFGYDPIGDITSIQRYTNITQPPNPSTDAADTTLAYNNLGQLTSEDHSHYGSAIENLSWTFDTLDRVSTFSSNDGLATYGYDKASQVVSATYSGSNPPPNVTETYDPNGNRIGNGYVVGANNLLASDGTFNYTHDAEGNVIKRVRISNAPANDYEVDYSWDYRNRLTDVHFYNNSHVLTKQEHDVYDVFNNLIEQDVDPTGSGTFSQVTHNVWDITSPLPPGEGQGEGSSTAGELDAAMGANVGGGQAAGAGEGGIVLEFNGQQQLTNRYLNGPNTNAADQHFNTLAEEAVSSLTTPGTVTFDLADDLGSVRNVVSATGSLLDHANYTVFGAYASESNPAEHHLTGFAGGLTDPSTGFDIFGERPYDPPTGRFIQPDHIGLLGGDTNEERYVGNDFADGTDPSGLRALTKADVENAEKEMRQAGLSETAIWIRLRILENTNRGLVRFGDKRNPEMWEEKDGQYVPKKGVKPLDAINDLWQSPGNQIQCKKYSSLIIIKSYADAVDDDELRDQINEQMTGKVIPNDLINEGEGELFQVKRDPTGPGFSENDLLPGDQVWFENPYYEQLTPQQRRLARYRGEEGSNVFYIGDGKVLAIYPDRNGTHHVYTIEEYRRRMMSFHSVRDHFPNANPSDFQIRRVRVPWVEQNNDAEDSSAD